MKIVNTLLFSLFCAGLSAQIKQNINKTSGTVSNPITEIDSIRFDENTNQMVVVTNSGNVSHSISEITNVTFRNGNEFPPCEGLTTVTDIDGNVYPVIQIGNQCWTAENLRTTRLNNGTLIPNVTDNLQWTNLTTPAWCNYDNNSTYDAIYGKLYNWYTVAAGSVCPAGWHVPTDVEWTQLTDFLGGESVAGGKMKTVTGWNPPNTDATNETGFSGLPGGYRFYTNGVFGSVGIIGNWWSNTEFLNFDALFRALFFDYGNAFVTNANKVNGFSIRCLKNTPLQQGIINGINCDFATNSGTLTQGTSASNVTCSVPYTGGNGGIHSGQTVSSTGVTGLIATLTAGTFQSGAGILTYIITGTPASSGTASFALNIGGQICTLNLSVNPAGETGITTHSCGATNVHNSENIYGSMTDQQGNVYRTILIGTQEWMAENLKTSVYRNGQPIANVTNNDQWVGLTTGAWCYYNNDIQYECPYGKLYNWYAVSDPRNVCPIGWHVPTDAEWTLLVNQLGGQLVAGGKMKSITGWAPPNTAATNKSGFSGLPGGYRNESFGVGSLGGGLALWSSSEVSLTTARSRGLTYGSGSANMVNANKLGGFSVRCLRD
jgi:uncharacterized protein (TIGR02145 family)